MHAHLPQNVYMSCKKRSFRSDEIIITFTYHQNCGKVKSSPVRQFVNSLLILVGENMALIRPFNKFLASIIDYVVKESQTRRERGVRNDSDDEESGDGRISNHHDQSKEFKIARFDQIFAK